MPMVINSGQWCTNCEFFEEIEFTEGPEEPCPECGCLPKNHLTVDLVATEVLNDNPPN